MPSCVQVDTLTAVNQVVAQDLISVVHTVVRIRRIPVRLQVDLVFLIPRALLKHVVRAIRVTRLQVIRAQQVIVWQQSV